MFALFYKWRSLISAYYNNGDKNKYSLGQVTLAGLFTGWSVTPIVVPVEQIKGIF
jgi:hypothetical protein